METIPLTWSVTWPDSPHTHAIDGACRDRGICVGRVTTSGNVTTPGWWSWYMTVTGPQPPYFVSTGSEPTKEGAKTALEASYRAMCAWDPETRDRWRDHIEVVRRGREMWARGGRPTDQEPEGSCSPCADPTPSEP